MLLIGSDWLVLWLVFDDVERSCLHQISFDEVAVHTCDVCVYVCVHAGLLLVSVDEVAVRTCDVCVCVYVRMCIAYRFAIEHCFICYGTKLEDDDEEEEREGEDKGKPAC